MTIDRILARIRHDLALSWRDVCWLFATIWRWLRNLFRSDRVIETTYAPPVHAIERAWRSAVQSRADIERDCRRVSTAIFVWTDATMTARDRARLPDNLPRSLPIESWLRGLNVHEISALKAAGALAIMHHVYGDGEYRVAGVRPVQPLEESTLVFPKPPPPTVNDLWDRLSGGPNRVRRIR